MPLSEIVNITTTTEAAGVTQAGFGVPLILSANATFPERVRTYTSLTELANDGFSTTGPEYLAASAMLAQNPRVVEFRVGRLANKPTQSWTISVASVLNDTNYTVNFGGNTYTYLSDGTATNDEIIQGLEALIDATPVAGFTASVTGAPTSEVLELVADAAGNWAQVEIADPALLAIAQDHADPGVDADLTAIALENNDWYGLINLYNSFDMLQAVSDYAESNEKLFVAATQDSKVITVDFSAADSEDIAYERANSGIERTALLYHPDNGEFADAAWAGLQLPQDPGSTTWKFKTLAGVPAVTLTSSHRTRLRDKNANFYYRVSGRNITSEGTVSSGLFIDIVRGRDWYAARLQERIANLLFNADKVPYTDAGIALIAAEVWAQHQEGIAADLIAEDPAPTVSVPRAVDVSAADKSARILRNVEFTFTLAGAVHSVEISGVISV